MILLLAIAVLTMTIRLMAVCEGKGCEDEEIVSSFGSSVSLMIRSDDVVILKKRCTRDGFFIITALVTGHSTIFGIPSRYHFSCVWKRTIAISGSASLVGIESYLDDIIDPFSADQEVFGMVLLFVSLIHHKQFTAETCWKIDKNPLY